jgi:CHC2 zinc finger
MTFHRENLPDLKDYYENTAGLRLIGRGYWRTTACEFHDGSDSMRVNLKTGAFKCMNCLIGGGDVLAYHQKAHDLDFVSGAAALGCWVNDGNPPEYKAPKFSTRSMLQVLALETQVVAFIAADLSRYMTISEVDRERLLIAVNRIGNISSEMTNDQL